MGVVYVDTCCCYACVDCGEPLEPRVVMVVLEGEMAEWSKVEKVL